MDVGRFTRLRESILGALKSVPENSSATSGDALPNAYKKYREAAKLLVETDHVEEFERLFPQWSRESASGSVRTGFDPLKASAASNEARALLGELAGWLEGFIVQARMTLEAEAYAREKLKAERGVGFKPSGDAQS